MDDDIKESLELYSMFHQEYLIMAEYRMLQTENLQGIYVIPSYESSFVWFGVIFIRSGIYEGGVFRFTLTLPKNFPNEDVPVLTLTTLLYHPAVDANSGVLSLSEVFPQWDRKCNHIWQILKYLNFIFHNLNVKVAGNTEALTEQRPNLALTADYSKLCRLKTNRKLFVEKVKECVAASIDHVYDDPTTEDRHHIAFQPYDPKVHDSAKDLMLKLPNSSEEISQGISWVQPGSYHPFSKEETT